MATHTLSWTRKGGGGRIRCAQLKEGFWGTACVKKGQGGQGMVGEAGSGVNCERQTVGQE